jgi:hypothetical protein
MRKVSLYLRKDEQKKAYHDFRSQDEVVILSLLKLDLILLRCK